MTGARKSAAQLVCPRCIAIEALAQFNQEPAVWRRLVIATTALRGIATDNGHAPLCPEHERASKGE